jgi:hypothetical protein
MARILLTWEAGSHLGHRTLVCAAALALQRVGHEVCVVAPEGVAPDANVHQAGLPWHTFPVLLPPGRPQQAWESRATTLQLLGFGDAAFLQHRVAAWAAALHQLQPDLVIPQAAPFAQVAARLQGLPTVEIGIGFDVPPCASPFLPYRNAQSFDVAQAFALEARLLDAVHGCARRLRIDSAPLPATLAAAVCGDIQLVTSLRELDHYGGERGQDLRREFVGPMPLLQMSDLKPRWQSGRPRLLAYVRNACMSVPTLVDAMVACKADAVIACPDADAALVEFAAPRRVRLLPHAIGLDELLPTADLVVCHGTGLVAEALVRGVRCLMFPSHFEQFLAARRLVAAGVGVMANPAEKAHYGPALRHVLADRAIAARAATIARTARSLDARKALIDAVDRLLTH